jgi:hypothetical protein
MQFTNYALTVLLPALAAAQGGAESIGSEIGSGLGAVSLPPHPITNPQTLLTTSTGNLSRWRSCFNRDGWSCRSRRDRRFGCVVFGLSRCQRRDKRFQLSN